MKWLYFCCLALFVACQTPSNIDLGAVVRETAEAVDRNHDGVVTKEEIRDSKNDPMFWTAIGGALLGLLGLNGARRAQRDTDELFDKLTGSKPS